ncbi:forkhead box protein E4-like [Haliotis asinina]|uniref:forkhead box protein E4-like n=1 Tax=Haliotis asinina TaxID=109174 RepID=UPI00353230AF
MMQNSPFEGNGYQTGLYGSSPGYDAGTIKLHHGHYPETESCYGNYMNTPNTSPNFLPREPPTYAESTFFHSGFVPNSSPSYYKVPNRQVDLNGYDIQRNDQVLIKPELPIGNGLDFVQRYDMEEPKVLHEMDATVTKLEHDPDQYKSTYQSLTAEQHDGQTEERLEQMNKEELVEEKKEEGTVDATDKNDEETGKNNPDVKPTLSYIALIAKSILESSQKRLNLGSIYSWIEKNYPYYQNKGQGWRNSVRHNLSLNDCFIKAGRCEDGKGNYWAIHPANIQDFMRGDFRQRRRSRRRGRKKEGEFGMYPMTNGYLSTPSATLNPGMGFNHPAAIGSIYSPYTEAERRAYKLDEALLRQSMNNPFMRWYHNGNYGGSNGTSCNSGMYGTSSGQWQGYSDNTSQSMYQSFSRSYSTPTLV